MAIYGVAGIVVLAAYAGINAWLTRRDLNRTNQKTDT